MSRHAAHLASEAAPGGVQALAAGAHKVETRSGFRKATGSIVYTALVATNTIIVNGVTFTIVASGATGNQINVGGSLSLTLDAVVTALNASTNPLVSVATYSKTGSNDTLTVVYDANGVAGNAFTIAGSVGTPSAATLAGGAEDSPVSIDAETTLLVTTAGAAMDFVLPAGVDGQEKTLYFKTKGSGANAVVAATVTGGTAITFDTAGDWIKLKWMEGAWRVLVNSSASIA